MGIKEYRHNAIENTFKYIVIVEERTRALITLFRAKYMNTEPRIMSNRARLTAIPKVDIFTAKINMDG